MTTAIEFQCPECGSSWFGTSRDVDATTGICHGHGCRFRWPRTEDYKVFHLVIKKSFSTPEEFKAAFDAKYNRVEIQADGNSSSPPG